jgi:hypothetical protein
LAKNRKCWTQYSMWTGETLYCPPILLGSIADHTAECLCIIIHYSMHELLFICFPYKNQYPGDSKWANRFLILWCVSRKICLPREIAKRYLMGRPVSPKSTNSDYTCPI